MKKFLFCSLIFIFAAVFASARTERFTGVGYSIDIEYNDYVDPGDAVFIRARFDIYRKTSEAKAKAEISNEKKSFGSCQFYILNSGRSSTEMLAGLALSSWMQSGSYEITVNYSINGETEMQFTLPLNVKRKEFESGVIELTQNMSNISSNTSPEKVAQSKKLNNIINSINPNNVYNLKSFILPVTSTRRTTAYAERTVYRYPSGKETTNIHYGIDFGKPNPKVAGHMDIVAPADGKVVMAENRIATGWTIILEHLPGLYSMYYHMSSLNVKVGQMVRQGEFMGLSGATGFATGEHLHWEMRLNSMIVNPDFFLENFAFE